MSQHREIVKHSLVYGAGQMLGRLASVLLLPLYTTYLRPADYGAIAILDLSASVIGILIGGGLSNAANRYHFDNDTREHQSAVWWTALIGTAVVAGAITVPAFFLRHSLADLTLGAQQTQGAFFWSLVLPTLWLGSMTQVPDQYFRVRKWSAASVVLSVGTLLLNIALNVYFLAVLHLGVAGMLWGNLITAAVGLLLRSVIMGLHLGRVRFDLPLAGFLWRFGGPMVVTALLSLVMHQADRIILRMFFSLDQVGVYSLAYTIGQGLNTLILVPFASIWAVVIYDIAKDTEAKRNFARIFEYFVYGLLLVFLGVCLFATPVLGYLIPGDYAGVAPLIPVVCLAFVFFSLHEHFKVPAMLAKRTVSLILPCALAAGANIALNFAVIPRFGAAGAAWTSVATYAIFSGVGLLTYRRIDHIDYPLGRCAMVLVAMSATYVVCETLQRFALPIAWSLAIPAAAWIAWALVLFLPLFKQLFPRRAFAPASS